VAGPLTLEADAGLALPERVELTGAMLGRATVSGRALSEGIHAVRVTGPDGLDATSNPLHVSAGATRILWADLHGHSNLSDGTGVPEDYYRYARDVAALEVAALTDHDHWGMRPL
jgi:hypothetical protein